MADLTDLGLSKYEARAYRSLLDVGPATAKQLSEASGVPMGRIYDVLGSVESRRLARSQAASRPKKYVPVDPETALDRLLADRKRDLEAKAEQYEAVVDELADELDRSPEPDDGFWRAAVGAADTLELILERIDAAETTVDIVSGAPPRSLDIRAASNRITDHLFDALERGVAVRALLSPDLVASIPETVNDGALADLTARDDVDVRVGGAVYGDVTLVDGIEVCVGLPNPVEPDEAFALLDLTDPDFAAQVRAEFERGWNEADALTADA